MRNLANRSCMFPLKTTGKIIFFGIHHVTYIGNLCNFNFLLGLIQFPCIPRLGENWRELIPCSSKSKHIPRRDIVGYTHKAHECTSCGGCGWRPAWFTHVDSPNGHEILGRWSDVALSLSRKQIKCVAPTEVEQSNLFLRTYQRTVRTPVLDIV